jgi:hypothetical protein
MHIGRAIEFPVQWVAESQTAYAGCGMIVMKPKLLGDKIVRRDRVLS